MVFHEIKFQAMYQPLLGVGGDASWHRGSAGDALVAALGLAGTAPRTLFRLVQEIHNSGLQLDRLMVRAAAMLWSVWLRSGVNRSDGVSFVQVEPPETDQLINGDMLGVFYEKIAQGHVGFIMSPDRPQNEPHAVHAVMRALLSRHLRWPEGVMYSTDLVWPELLPRNAPARIGYAPEDTMPAGIPQSLTPSDIFTAMECICADFGVPVSRFDHQWVDCVAVRLRAAFQRSALGLE